MNPIKPTPSVRHNLDADLTTLARVLRNRAYKSQDRVRIAGSVLACIRVRKQLGTYGMSRRERDPDFVRELAMPTPN